MAKNNKKLVDMSAKILALIGGANWFTIGLFSYNFVNALIPWNWLVRTVYVVSGASIIYIIGKQFKK